MPIYRYGIDPDEHGDYTAGITRVQVAEPPAPPAGFGAPNPNASPVYALFQAGRLEIRVDGDEDLDTPVGRPILENGRLTKRDLIAKLNGITAIRDYFQQNPDPESGIGGLVKHVAAQEVFETVSGTVLDELEELRAFRRRVESETSVTPPREEPRTIEEIAAATARPPMRPNDIISGLRPGETRCTVEGCGKWTKLMHAHIRAAARNGKKLRAEHEAERIKRGIKA